MRLEGWRFFNILALGLALTLLLEIPAQSATLPAFTADSRYASVVVDAETGRVLSASNADQALYPASLTKIMTLYMTFDALKRGQITLKQSHRVSQHAASMTPTKLGLRPGDSITTDQAILALVTKSANDVAVVLAEALSGNEEEFGRAMTHRARSLGMPQTVFVNASGLPDSRQISSARDMAVLALAMLRDHPRHYRYFSTQEFVFRGQVHHNHNRLLGAYDGVDGLKTGFINASGFNLVASAQRDGRRVIGVVFGGSSGRARDAHMANLLDDGFRSLEVSAPRAPDSDNPLVRVAEQKPSAKAGPKTSGLSADEIERQAIEAASRRAWAVQVGVFKTQVQAKRAIADTLKRTPKLTTTAAGDVMAVKVGAAKRYRARLQNLSASQAKSVCDELKRRKQACLPVPPAAGTLASSETTSTTRTH